MEPDLINVPVEFVTRNELAVSVGAIGTVLLTIIGLVYRKHKKSDAKLEVELIAIKRALGISDKALLASDKALRISEKDLGTSRLDNSELQKAMHLKDIALSSTSHELKNPLAALKLILEMEAKKFPENKYTQDSMRQVARITDLVANLYNASQIKNDRYVLNPQPIVPCVIVAEVVAHLRMIFPERKITMNMLGIEIEADAVAIYQIFNNLISNACKYSPVKTPIKIIVTKKARTVLFEVKDQGEGLKGDVKKLFEPYAQFENGSGKGLGLGLFLVSRLVKLHKGSIYFSTSKKGTSFFVSLPIGRPYLRGREA